MSSVRSWSQRACLLASPQRLHGLIAHFDVTEGLVEMRRVSATSAIDSYS